MSPMSKPYFKCSVVPIRFSSKYDYSSVEEDSDDDLFERIFRCSKCHESFNIRRQLQRHVRKAHLNVRKERRDTLLVRSLLRSELGMDNEGEAESSSKESTVSCVSIADHTKDTDWNSKLNPRCSFSIVVPRLKFLEISISTPMKGFREIYFTSKADTILKSAGASGSSSEGGSRSADSSSPTYEDYRIVCIEALPKKIRPPEPPSMYKYLNPPPPPAPPEENKSLLIKMPYESSCMFNVNGIKDYNLHAIVDVLTGEKMSTVVLDAYLNYLVSSYNNEINAGVRSSYKLRPISKTNFHCLSVCFLPVFTRNQCPSTFEVNPRHLPKVALDEDCVLIAPMYSCRHYYLAVFNCYTRCVYVYDSSWKFMPDELRIEQVKKVLVSLFPFSEHRWKIFFNYNCAQQIDEYSCGCYVIYFTENHLKSKSHRNIRNLSKAEVKQLRNDIVKELLPTTKTGSQLLDAITE